MSTPDPILNKSRISFDGDKAVKLAEQGVDQLDIAKVMDVNQSNVSRYLSKVKVEKKFLTLFRDARGDALAYEQADNLEFIRELKEVARLRLPHMTTNEIRNFTNTLMWGTRQFHEMERLEMGKSTVNVGIKTQLVEAAHKVDKPASEQPKPDNEVDITPDK